MKNYLIIALLLAIGACGESTVKVKDSSHTIGGEAYQYVIVRFEFIQKIKRLCKELYLESDFNTVPLYNQAVAQCTFDNLSILDLGAIGEFKNGFCDQPTEGLTPEEQLQVDQICDAL